MKRPLLRAFLLGLAWNLLYFALCSRPLYRAGYFIPTYHPMGLLLGAALCVLMNRLRWKLEKPKFWLALGWMLLLVFLVPVVMDLCFGRTLRDFYLRGYENLFRFAEYYRDVLQS